MEKKHRNLLIGGIIVVGIFMYYSYKMSSKNTVNSILSSQRPA